MPAVTGPILPDLNNNIKIYCQAQELCWLSHLFNIQTLSLSEAMSLSIARRLLAQMSESSTYIYIIKQVVNSYLDSSISMDLA